MDRVGLASGLRPLGSPGDLGSRDRSRTGRATWSLSPTQTTPHRLGSRASKKARVMRCLNQGLGLPSELWNILLKVWGPRAAWLASGRYTQKVLLLLLRLGVGQGYADLRTQGSPPLPGAGLGPPTPHLTQPWGS